MIAKTTKAVLMLCGLAAACTEDQCMTLQTDGTKVKDPDCCGNTSVSSCAGNYVRTMLGTHCGTSGAGLKKVCCHHNVADAITSKCKKDYSSGTSKVVDALCCAVEMKGSCDTGYTYAQGEYCGDDDGGYYTSASTKKALYKTVCVIAKDANDITNKPGFAKATAKYQCKYDGYPKAGINTDRRCCAQEKKGSCSAGYTYTQGEKCRKNDKDGNQYFATVCASPVELARNIFRGMTEYDWETKLNSDGTFSCNMDGYVDLTAQAAKLLLFVVSLVMEIALTMLPKQLALSLGYAYDFIVYMPSWIGYVAAGLYYAAVEYGFGDAVCEGFGYANVVIEALASTVDFSGTVKETDEDEAKEE